MTETDSRQRELEERTATVDSWVKTISEEGTAGEEVTPEILRRVFAKFCDPYKISNNVYLD